MESKIITIGLITNLKAESKKAKYVSDSSSASSIVCGKYREFLFKKNSILIYINLKCNNNWEKINYRVENEKPPEKFTKCHWEHMLSRKSVRNCKKTMMDVLLTSIFLPTVPSKLHFFWLTSHKLELLRLSDCYFK